MNRFFQRINLVIEMVKMTGGGCQKSIPIERITIPTVYKIGGFFADKLYIHGLLGATFVTLSLL